MNKELGSSFNTYQAFATNAFESGLHSERPARTGQASWDKCVAVFATLSFNESLTIQKLADESGATKQAVHQQNAKVESHLRSRMPEELQDIYTPDILRKSFRQRVQLMDKWGKNSITEKGRDVLEVRDAMDIGFSFDEAIALLDEGRYHDISYIRDGIKRKGGYNLPESNYEQMVRIRGSIGDPNIAPEELRAVFNELTRSRQNSLSNGQNSALVSFMKQIRKFGLVVDGRMKDTISLLEEELFKRDLVVGKVPFFVKQKDGTYEHAADYHFIRELDSSRLDEQEGFIVDFFNSTSERQKYYDKS